MMRKLPKKRGKILLEGNSTKDIPLGDGMSTLLFTFFSLWLVALCVADLRSRRLPNALTLGGAAVALVLHAMAGGGLGVVDALEGGLVCAALLLLPFLLQAAGGGDVKMLFAVGCFFGSLRAIGALFWISIAGLALALVFLVFGRVDRSRLVHYARCVFDWRYDRKAGRVALPPKSSERARVPFGLAIAAGAWLELLRPL